MKFQSNVLNETIDQVVSDGVRRGLGHLSAQDFALDGRTVRLHDQEVLNLGTASYLNLERHPRLVAGAQEMLERYGTQFSASRAYVQLSLYDELESNLETIFGQPALVTGSTTLGHFSAIPVLVDDRDAIILDQQVHSSMQTAVQIVRARGVPVHIVRHNRMDSLEERILKLRGKHRVVWYFADGVYSMFGDGAPAQELHALMDRYPNFRCYIDDAHGFGWTGKHGLGWFRSRVPHHRQLVMAVSLNKSYASGGGALIFPTREEKQKVRNCGPTMIFCGPVQPPMLGAALAATQLHMSADIKILHAALQARIVYCREGLIARGLPQVEANDTPLYFIPVGMPKLVQEIAHRLMQDGFYVNLGIFPAVPTSMGGVRFHMHRGLEFDDIDRFLDSLEIHYKDVLCEAKITPEKLARSFRMPHLRSTNLNPTRRSGPEALSLHCVERLCDVPPDLWDPLFEGCGPLTRCALAALSDAFEMSKGSGRASARFAWVTDVWGRVVVAAPYCVTSVKEDMFSPAEVSARVEARRAEEGEEFLVTTAISLGLPITLGRHLFVDRKHSQWSDALRCFLDHLNQEKEAYGASRVLLREFETGADPALAQQLLDEGYVEVAMPSMMHVRDMRWTDRDGYMASLKGRYRREVRKEILPYLSQLRIDTGPLSTPTQVNEAYTLYRKVHARGLALNVQPLPKEVFTAMVQHEEFDVLRFSLGEQLSAVMVSHVRGEQYTALLVGFEAKYVQTHNIYKTSLFLTVERARALGCTAVNLAFTADVTKQKVGARPVPTCAYVLMEDTFSAHVLNNL